MSTIELNQKCAELRKADEAFFREAFSGMNCPQTLRTASERICRAYGLNGVCDPGYIANLIAVELGLGDGKSHFN